MLSPHLLGCSLSPLSLSRGCNLRADSLTHIGKTEKQKEISSDVGTIQHHLHQTSSILSGSAFHYCVPLAGMLARGSTRDWLEHTGRGLLCLNRCVIRLLRLGLGGVALEKLEGLEFGIVLEECSAIGVGTASWKVTQQAKRGSWESLRLGRNVYIKCQPRPGSLLLGC